MPTPPLLSNVLPKLHTASMRHCCPWYAEQPLYCTSTMQLDHSIHTEKAPMVWQLCPFSFQGLHLCRSTRACMSLDSLFDQPFEDVTRLVWSWRIAQASCVPSNVQRVRERYTCNMELRSSFRCAAACFDHVRVTAENSMLSFLPFCEATTPPPPPRPSIPGKLRQLRVVYTY